MSSFRTAFSSAREKKQTTFTYNGKSFLTETASEANKKLSDKQLTEKRYKDYSEAKKRGFKSKSHNEIVDSNTKEYWKRKGK